VKRRLVALAVVALSAACGLLLAAHAGTVRADSSQPPLRPPAPTVAARVSVGIPSSSLHVQGGGVDGSSDGPISRPEHARNNRLLLQLGVLGAFIYLACLAAWFCVTRLKLRRA
jgi:hypothetical protein